MDVMGNGRNRHLPIAQSPILVAGDFVCCARDGASEVQILRTALVRAEEQKFALPAGRAGRYPDLLHCRFPAADGGDGGDSGDSRYRRYRPL